MLKEYPMMTCPTAGRLADTRMRGFTLIELMIVVVIVAILAGIAYPSYTRYVIQARRTDGQSALLQLSARLEKYLSQCGKYTTETAGDLSACTGLGLGAAVSSPESHYTLTIAAGSSGDIKTSYLITAAPASATQLNDTECKNLTYNNAGDKGISGGTKSASECWKR